MSRRRPVFQRACLAGLLLALCATAGFDEDRGGAPSDTTAAAAGEPEVPAEQPHLSPNVLDTDGTPAFVHFTQADMPLVVAIPEPGSGAKDRTEEETRRAAIKGFLRWQERLHSPHPWFRLEFRKEDPKAHIQVVWKKRPHGYLPARGKIGYHIEDGHLKVHGEVVLSTQPVPNARFRVSEGELVAHAMHAFGSALGLPDCFRCRSIMAMDWRRHDPIEITDIDIRTFGALITMPNGQREDGRPLKALRPDANLPDVAAAPPDGVLADLPFINTGRGDEIVIDVAPQGQKSLTLTLDTGATETVLSTNYARALGISVRSIKSDPYRRTTVTGDPLRFWVMGQRVVGGGRGPTHFNYALLGGEYLGRYVIDLDFEKRRVRFLDPKRHRVGDPESPLEGEIVIDLSVREKRPYAKLELGSGSVWALVDTGAMAPLITTEDKARELGIEIDRSGEHREYVNVLGRTVDSFQTLPEARLGPLLLNDVQIGISIKKESSVRVARWLKDQTILGVEILQNYRVRLDYPRQKMGLTPIRVGQAR